MSGSDRVWALTALGRRQEAAALAEELLADDPDDTDLHVAHSQALLTTDVKGAIAAAERAIALDPDDLAALAALCRGRLAAEEHRKALAVAETLRERAPYWPDAHLLHSLVLLRQATAQAFPHKGTLDRAREGARWLQQRLPNDPAGHLLQAEIDLAARNHLGARRHATRALGIDPTNARAHEILGLLAEHDGNYDTASRHYVAVGQHDTATGVSRLRALGKAGPAVGLLGGLAIFGVARAVLRLSIDAGDYRWLVLVAALVAVALIGLREYRERSIESVVAAPARAIRDTDAALRAPNWRHWGWWTLGRRGTSTRLGLAAVVLAIGAVGFMSVPSGDGTETVDGQVADTSAADELLERVTSGEYRSLFTLQAGDCLLDPIQDLGSSSLNRIGACDEPAYGRFVVNGALVDRRTCEAAIAELYGDDVDSYLLDLSTVGMGATCIATSDTPIIWTPSDG